MTQLNYISSVNLSRLTPSVSLDGKDLNHDNILIEDGSSPRVPVRDNCDGTTKHVDTA